MVEIGKKAPEFRLPNSDGNLISLDDFLGKKVVLYFYPKDDTPGCTKEACSFRDQHEEIESKNAVVLGISPDSSASHQKFAAKWELPFQLLSDEEHKTAEAYGAWGEKTTAGKTSQGILRSTFLIDEKGIVAKIVSKVNVDEHGAEMAALL